MRLWQKRWNVCRIPSFGFTVCRSQLLSSQYWEGVWPHLDPWDVVRLRTSSSYWNAPGRYGPHSELFFFLIKKEPQFKPSVLAETLKACALIGLHLLAAEGGSGSANRGPRVKAFLRPTFATTMWKALLCMLSDQIGQAERCPFSWKTVNQRGWP